MTKPFLLHTDSKSVYIRKGDAPSEVVALPDISEFELAGDRVIAVPFTLAHVIHMRRAGFAVPSPIGYEYEFPKLKGLHEPWANQRETAAFLTLNPRAYCLSQVGTGKTDAALFAADYLRRAGYVRKVLIVTTKSTMRSVWANAIHNTFFMQRAVVLHTEAKRRRHLLAQDFDYYIVNHDGLEILGDKVFDEKRRLIDFKFGRDDIDLFIFDEIGEYRNASTMRWAVANKMLQPHHWVWGLTATPIPDYPADAYAQIRLVTPTRVSKHYTTFRQMVMSQVSEYKWRPRPEAAQIIHGVMQPAIAFTRDQCYDMPETLPPMNRDADLTPEQAKHWRDMANNYATEFASGARITAVNEGVKLSKLLQIACGVVYDKQGGEVVLPCGPRLATLLEAINEGAGKVIVFCPFTSVVDMVAKYLTKHGRHCETITGATASNKRADVFADFQGAPYPNTLVADPGTMAHGVTLTEADTVIWYGTPRSNNLYEQANGRITRSGQKRVQRIIHIVSTAVERKRFAELASRAEVQGSLIEMVKSGEIYEVNQ